MDATMACNELYRMMTRGKSLEAIVARASELLGNPVIVPDATGGVVACSPQAPADDAMWSALLDSEKGGAQLIDLRENDELADVEQARGDEVLLLDASVLEHRWLYARVDARYYRIANVCVPEVNEPFGPDDEEIVACVRDLVAFLYERNNGWQSERNVAKRQMLIKLVEGAPVSHELFWDIYEKVDPSRPLLMYVIACESVGSVERQGSLIDHLRWVEQNVRGVVGMSAGDTLVFLVVRNVVKPLSSVLVEAPQALVSYAEEQGLVLGVSRAMDGLDMFASRCRQAKDAMRLCQNAGCGSCATYDDVYFSRMYEAAAGSGDMDAYVWGKVLDVMRYDAREGTDYLHDLTAYLSTGCSNVETAKLLGIHRNTVKYRVEKIASLFGLDYSDQETLFCASLSVRLVACAQQSQGRAVMPFDAQ